ncbi:MAG: sulfite exporter TauE/SafE family protein [Acidobacteria bacterium]|nr:sulfite exporter TauE/SafE family protein [Acidobacteriota bacterium]
MVHALIVFVTAVVAGAINSIAAGGSLLTFPTLIWLGVPSINANATNIVAIWPGSLGSVWAYRRELRDTDPRVYTLIVPSAIGAALGALLLSRTPRALFDGLVPVLITFATVLFMLQDRIRRRLDVAAGAALRKHWLAWATVLQLLVGLYGGYYGAAQGIPMLAALSLTHTDIHQINGLKNLLASCINAVATVFFIIAGLVVWGDAAAMAAGTLMGGVGGALLARRIGRAAVRRLVVVIGFGMAISLLLRL